MEREAAWWELHQQAEILKGTAEEAVGDTNKLHDRLERSRMTQEHNKEVSIFKDILGLKKTAISVNRR